jgi:teichuronic acid biosynthesis glycosyltransferase TuaH
LRVLYLSEVQWLSQVSRKHQFIRRFPEDWETLFLSPVNTAPGENSFAERTETDGTRVRYRSLLLPKPDSRSAALRAFSPLLASAGYRSVMSLAGAFRPDVAVFSYIWGAPLIPRIRKLGVPVVYDCNDLHAAFYPARREEAERMFRSTVESADEVVSSSERLREVCGRGVVVGNGVDLDTFRGRSDTPLPSLIAGTPLEACRDLVIYVGSVDDRIDFRLLRELARALDAEANDVGLVCVGRIFDGARSDVDRLVSEHPSRVLFTGRAPYDELPSYLSHASVGIAPFVINEKTAAINPNKLYMYAAMDMNIVATPFSADVREYADLIYTGESPASFASAVLKALGDDERRRAVRERIALPNSWNEKARIFREVLLGVVNSRH